MTQHMPASACRFLAYSTVTVGNEQLTRDLRVTEAMTLYTPSTIAVGSYLAPGSVVNTSPFLSDGYQLDQDFPITTEEGLNLNSIEIAAGSTVGIPLPDSGLTVATAVPVTIPTGNGYQPAATIGALYTIPNGTILPAGIPTVEDITVTADVVLNADITLGGIGTNTTAGAEWADGTTVAAYVIAAPPTAYNNPVPANTLLHTGFIIPAGTVPNQPWLLQNVQTTVAAHQFPAGTVFPVGTGMYLEGLDYDTNYGVTFVTSESTVAPDNVFYPYGTVFAKGSTVINAAPLPGAPMVITTGTNASDSFSAGAVTYLAPGSILKAGSIIADHTAIPSFQRLDPNVNAPMPKFYKVCSA